MKQFQRWWKMSKKTQEKKFNQKIKALDKITDGTEKDIIKAYQSALKEVKSILADAYEKHGMDMAEMQKYKRLQKLEKSIQTQLTKVSRESSTAIRQGVKQNYEEAFYRTAYELETELQLGLAYTEVDPKIIGKVVNSDITGLRWIERMGKNRSDTMYQIKQELAQGLIRGESYPEMARRLQKRFDIDFNKAVTIARTEAGRARSEGTYDSMKHAEDMGIEITQRWVSVFDDRTRTSHQYLDGEEIGLDDTFSNGLSYPREAGGLPEEVINCRCQVRTIFAGMEETDRLARNEDGDNVYVPHMKYTEWRKTI